METELKEVHERHEKRRKKIKDFFATEGHGKKTKQKKAVDYYKWQKIKKKVPFS